MSITKIADIVVGIPYGDQGKKRWRNVGALLQHSDNDPSKGPGFTIVLEQTFNPAGAPGKEGQVMLSCFHPTDSSQRAARSKDDYRAPPPRHEPYVPEDDIPF